MWDCVSVQNSLAGLGGELFVLQDKIARSRGIQFFPLLENGAQGCLPRAGLSNTASPDGSRRSIVGGQCRAVGMQCGVPTSARGEFGNTGSRFLWLDPAPSAGHRSKGGMSGRGFR